MCGDVAQVISNTYCKEGEKLRENLYNVALKLKTSQAEMGATSCLRKDVSETKSTNGFKLSKNIFKL